MTSTSSTGNNLRYLFDRPCEPIFRQKGVNGDVVFSVPTSYLTDRYKPMANEVQIRFPTGTGTTIPVRESTPPDITVPMTLPRKSNFSLFNDLHKECASSLITTLMNIQSLDELQSALVYTQQRVNPYLFIYALSVVMLHRNDTRNISIPSHVCTFPELYIPGSTLSDARAVISTIPDGSRAPIELPRDLTSSDNEVEHRLAYFREDIGVNLHHWHWHMVYPTTGPTNIVTKDRRGELFYYMHQQIVARYNIERFSNNLSRAMPISDFHKPIPEGYFPKLDTVVASRVWAARQTGALFTEIARESDQTYITVEELERWRDRIFEAIQRGSVYRGTDLVPLQESDGIDVLGNIIEASNLSVNRSYYGNFHNQGHNMISFLHDPDNRYLEAAGVMWDNTVAMRDPIFYRWHTTINNMFTTYKETLTPYTTDQLSFSSVQVTELSVVTTSSSGGATVNNVFQTHWEKDRLDLSRGLDFVPRGPIEVNFSHLQHDPFTFRIVVQNSGAQRMGTVRIFLAPKQDERVINFRFRDQRGFFIELDRFTTTLRAGRNEIQRRSIESTITVPYSVTFRNLEDIPLTSDNAAQNFVYCGCGWPDHMLIPKGLPGTGMLCDLFVMVSDYQQDRIENTSMDVNNAGCDNAFAFCGVRNSRYPDRRAMGFPFDRLPRTGVVTLQQFLTANMRTVDVHIKFEERETLGTSLQTQTATSTTQRPATQTTQTATGTTQRPATQTTQTTTGTTQRPATQTTTTTTQPAQSNSNRVRNN